MTLGIDLSPLQGPHRMRGIGAVAVNFINNLPEKTKANTTFIFFIYADTPDYANPLENLNLTGINYTIKFITDPSVKHNPGTKPTILKKILGKVSKLQAKNIRRTLVASDGFNAKELDRYIQFDPTVALIDLPRHTKKCLMVHDLIPYVLESDYLWSYRTTRKHGNTRRSALKHAYHRQLYKHIISVNTKHADIIFADSKHTKSDIIKYIGTRPDKINVALLGVNKVAKSNERPTSFMSYVETSWGAIPRGCDLPNKPYLLFSGGVDPRRKLVDLLAAYNNLRARGEDIALVLVGDTMEGLSNIPNSDVQHYLKENTSYREDIYCLGFVTQNEIDYLYRNALAFVYPSVYEGFGLPVLEAMRYGTPVITYRNSSIQEIGGKAALYADDHTSITTMTQRLLYDKDFANKAGRASVQQANRFKWEDTVINILTIIE